MTPGFYDGAEAPPTTDDEAREIARAARSKRLRTELTMVIVVVASITSALYAALGTTGLGLSPFLAGLGLWRLYWVRRTEAWINAGWTFTPQRPRRHRRR